MLKRNRALLPFLILIWCLIQIGRSVLTVFRLSLNTFLHIYQAFSLSVSSISISFKFIFSVLICALIITTAGFVAMGVIKDLPSPERLSQLNGPQTTYLYDREGNFLYKLYEDRNRNLVKIDELPQDLVNATIAIEDKNFYNHPGIDFFAIIRALMANIQYHELQGGSTITQQLIKNTLLSPERTVNRKIRELVLAYWTERIYSKSEILQMYFNEAPYGGTAWGVEAAAQTYFNKQSSQLNLAESAFLAGLPASPTEYFPYGPTPQEGKERQKEVLKRMVEDGYISKDDAKQAYEAALYFQPPTNELHAPHFVMYIRSELAKKYGEKAVSQGGLKVITTIDLKFQKMAEQVVSEEVEKLKPLNVSNSAAMITDAKTGHILAMVGSKNYSDPQIGNYNVALALRQPGSSIKPVTYVAAFKQGYTPSTILLDTPVSFKNPWETYSPVNYDGKFHGPVTIRTALGSSYNVPAVKMLALIGIPEMIQTARDLGITTFESPDRYGLSLTLGGGEVKMIDMMTVYSTFSQMGVKRETTGILKVTDADGLILEDNSQRQGVQVLPSGIAYLITNILTDNNARTPAFGPNSLLNISGHQVAVKTGTTDSKRDNWTFGYTLEFVVGVWVGNNDNTPMHPVLTSGITGATPIWNRLMTNILKDRQFVAFARPDDVIEVSIGEKKDLAWKGHPPKVVVVQSKKKIKDEKTNQEKETITFTDPFTTFTTDQVKIP